MIRTHLPLHRLVAFLLAAVSWVQAAETDDWFEFQPKNDAAPGVIGMQDWLEKPAGKRGPLRIEKDGFVLGDGTPIKFWGVNLGNLDNAPDPDTGRAWADRYAKYGVNCVRLHKFMPDIMAKESSTRFDPERAGNFDAFTHTLRERGMYYGFSWVFSHKVRSEDRDKLRHFDEIMAGGGETSRVLIFIAEDVQDLRIEMLTNLLQRKNPHTGLAYAQDPALAFVEFQNEDSIFFFTFGAFTDLSKFPSYKTEFNRKFSEWLRARYRTQQELEKAWGPRALNAYDVKDESLDRGNILVQGNPWHFSPDGLKEAEARGTTVRVLDTARFLHEVQTALYAKFEKAVRAAGYAGPLVASPWTTPPGLPRYLNLETDARIGIVDRHTYFGGLGGWQPRPGKFEASSQLGAPGRGLLSQGLLQVAGRPFALSEWNTVFPNAWAPESLTLVAAYGLGLQGWDASYHFASHTRERKPMGFSRKLDDPRLWNVDVPNQIGLYPVLARMVYRGDVRTADTIGVRRVNLEAAMREVPEWMNRESSKVSEGLGDFKDERTVTPNEALAVGRLLVEFTEKSAENTEPDLRAHIQGDVITSATGQLRWTRRPEQRGWIAIDTPGTQAAVGFLPSQPVALGDVTVLPEDQFAAIYVSALRPDGALATAPEALLTAIARVRNTGMEFSADGKELLKLGAAPMRCEPVRARLTFKRPLQSVEKLDVDGLPTGQLMPLEADGSFKMDTGRDQTLYYRVRYR
jgi:hypothetical protein